MYVRVHFTGINDYYEGDHVELWLNEELVWDGYPNDKLTEILDALGIIYERSGKTHIQQLLGE